MSRDVSIDSRTRLVPEGPGWRVVRSDGKRSRVVYETQAAALRAVVTDAVQWDYQPVRRATG